MPLLKGLRYTAVFSAAGVLALPSLDQKPYTVLSGCQSVHPAARSSIAVSDLTRLLKSTIEDVSLHRRHGRQMHQDLESDSIASSAV